MNDNKTTATPIPSLHVQKAAADMTASFSGFGLGVPTHLGARGTIATYILAAYINRPDSGLFNYEEKADMAVEQADALLRRLK